ncbi:hypothetical protein ARMGADRAFT_1031831 [Armillaria gallica]|uniref:Uncharacterized protein n=1 Tax=Armillaria gallica TaxID=47427 RepID=A0A2H3DTZ0_ARMGA|nr:hypothetical protein ARMGADRAFT_1031831 [Armillaria gallica]
MKPSPRAQLFRAWPGSAWLSLGLQARPYRGRAKAGDQSLCDHAVGSIAMPRLVFFTYTQPSDRDRSHLFSQSHMQQAAFHMASEFSNKAKPNIWTMLPENICNIIFEKQCAVC